MGICGGTGRIYFFMEKKERGKRKVYRAAAVLLAATALLPAFFCGRTEKGEHADSAEGVWQEFLIALEESMMELWCPVCTFSADGLKPGLWEAVSGQFPLFSFVRGQNYPVLLSESGTTYEEIIRAEGRDEYSEDLEDRQMRTPEHSEGRISADARLEELLRQENEAARENGEVGKNEEARENGAAGENEEVRKDGAKSVEKEGFVDRKGEEDGLSLPENKVAESSIGLLQKKESYQWDYYKKFGEGVLYRGCVHRGGRRSAESGRTPFKGFFCGKKKR